MAIVKCRECEADVSSEAKSCPKCGIDRPYIAPSSPIRSLIGIGIVFATVWFVGANFKSTHTAEPQAEVQPEKVAAPVKRAATPDPAAEKRYGECKQRLATAISQGLLTDLRPALPLKIQVGLRWYGLTLAQKNAFLSDVNCFTMHGTTDLLPFDIVDGHSGKTVGSYSVSGYEPK